MQTTRIDLVREERWLEAGPGPMRYWVSVPRHGLPVLLLHGYGSLIEHWGPVMGPLAQAHTCYALDLYGFGYSAPRSTFPGIRLWAGQVADMLHHVVQAPAVLVGNSLGGTVAAHVARDYPHLVRGIVLVDAIGMPGVVAALPPGKQLFFRAAQSPLGSVMMRLLDGPAGVRQFLHALYHRRERITPELVATLSGPFRRPNTAPFCLSVLRSLERITLDMRPGDVTTPTLIVWGEKDPALSPLMACALQQYIFPHASLHLIPRSGHCPFDETPEAFCDIVIPWIASLTKPDNPH